MRHPHPTDVANALEQLEARWMDQASDYERDGVMVRGDRLLRRVVEEMQESRRVWRLQPLTIKQAAQESGLSESRLRQLVAERKIPNVGRKGAPRILRMDLPRKV